MDNKTAGDAIREWREKNGYSQEDFAEALGYSRARRDMIAHIECGRRKLPRKLLLEVSKITGIPIDVLIK